MRGIVIGKFYPPHLGHNYLIDTALNGCDQLTVLVVDNPDYHIPALNRASWLQEHHPGATVRIIPDINNDDDSTAWAAHTLAFLGYKPDVVFSSETYGKPWAEAMQCKSVLVDLDRTTFPISGTLVRKDMMKSWQYLSREVKAGLALRIVVLGTESTGTTTLSRDLAAALNVPWVPEVGRYYTESILTSDIAWNNDDFYAIGRLQQAYENEIAARSNGVIVCDTNAVATELWQKRYMGETTEAMKIIAANDKADLYIITGDEIPFVQDGIRDGEHIRHKMHQWFETHIASKNVPYIIVRGERSERLLKALTESKNMIKNRKIIY
ncbi:AAA family ATPase [Microbacteriaceae bacterium]|nr:AAA family ATPase [Candidatus Saccharibacteria bacterium]